jgi:hypothetical protein
VDVVRQGRTSMTVVVHGDGTPVWLVLGQSQSSGWHATTATGVGLGSSTLIDGYANGWYLPAALVRGTTTVTLTWTPQRVVDVALVASGATLVVSVVLIALPPRFLVSGRRRRRRGEPRDTPPAAPEPDEVAEAGASVTGDPPRPVLASVLRSGGSAPTWPRALGIALLGGLVAGVVVAPLAGVLTAAILLVELMVDRSRVVVVAGTVALLLATVGYVAAEQNGNAFASDINWPSHTGLANSLVWLALCLLGTDGLVQWVRHRRGGRAAVAPPGSSGPA